MIIILGAGIIGLSIGYDLLKKGKKVKIFDSSAIKAKSTNASIGMLAPLIEAKPLETLPSLNTVFSSTTSGFPFSFPPNPFCKITRPSLTITTAPPGIRLLMSPCIKSSSNSLRNSFRESSITHSFSFTLLGSE